MIKLESRKGETLVQISLSIGILMVAGAVAYYFLYLLPQQNSLKLVSSGPNVSNSNEQAQQPTLPPKPQAQSQGPIKGSSYNPPLPNTSSGEIVQSEVEPFKKVVFKVFCYTNGQLHSTGSGFSKNIPGVGKVLITNKHVITTNDCGINNFENGDSVWNIDTASISFWNDLTDQAILPIFPAGNKAMQTKPYQTDDLPTIDSVANASNCPAKIPTDSSIIIMGYPASTSGFVSFGPLTVTRGVVSAYSYPPMSGSIAQNYDSMRDDYLPDTNYYVDAQIDSGNSGGLALSKNNGKLCLLGIPTWVSLTGNFQAPGIVQSMNNIMYVKK